MTSLYTKFTTFKTVILAIAHVFTESAGMGDNTDFLRPGHICSPKCASCSHNVLNYKKRHFSIKFFVHTFYGYLIKNTPTWYTTVRCQHLPAVKKVLSRVSDEGVEVLGYKAGIEYPLIMPE